eukprot:s193_g11.t1
MQWCTNTAAVLTAYVTLVVPPVKGDIFPMLAAEGPLMRQLRGSSFSTYLFLLQICSISLAQACFGSVSTRRIRCRLRPVFRQRHGVCINVAIPNSLKQPNIAYRTSPLYQEVKNKLVTLRKNRFLPEKLRSGLSFPGFKRELFRCTDKNDGNFVEGYESAKGQKRHTVQWFWGHHVCFGAGDDKFEVTDNMGDK